jgi:4-carboxymuconolactone decarboxylase
VTNQIDSRVILGRLVRFEPEFDIVSRLLAVHSASIGLADKSVIKSAMLKAAESGAATEAIYEMTLQSYLFVGFPRMLTAAESFREVFPKFSVQLVEEVSPNKVEDWKIRGLELCQKVYSENYEKLKNRVKLFSPEIFEWMILEGYGKVLSRPGLDIKARELGIVACLIIDNRPTQLFSHIRGALNVGVEVDLIAAVTGDVENIFGVESQTARGFLDRLRQDV